MISLSLWRGQSAQTASMLMEMEGGPFPISGTIVSFLWRGGDHERARAYYEDHRPIELGADDWFAMLAWCMAAETALVMADPGLGSTAYDRLVPYAGMSCAAGSGNASGPVDAFLAMAAMSTGELALATRHADDAVRLCEVWEIPLAAQWLRNQRDRFGF
jgi:hypothetical protein